MPRRNATEPSAAVEPARPAPKERAPFHLPAEIIDRMRDAAYWVPGETLAAIAERGIARELGLMERSHGGPFEKRRAELKPGRRIGS